MDHLIRSSTRVIRKLDDASILIESFPALENAALTDASTLIDYDRIRILDSPDPETQLSNIAAS